MSETEQTPRVKRAYTRRTPPQQTAPADPGFGVLTQVAHDPGFGVAGPSVSDPGFEAPERPPMRPAMRPEDPRERARRRAAEIRAGGVMEEGTDRFAVDRRQIPDGFDYEWKRKTTFGQEDPAYAVNLARTGWEPVPSSRHPEMMPRGWSGAIERDGMVLMERPKEISDEYRDRDRRAARDAVAMKEAQLNGAPPGTLPRDAHPGTKAIVRKGYEPLPIPPSDGE